MQPIIKRSGGSFYQNFKIFFSAIALRLFLGVPCRYSLQMSSRLVS